MRPAPEFDTPTERARRALHAMRQEALVARMARDATSNTHQRAMLSGKMHAYQECAEILDRALTGGLIRRKAWTRRWMPYDKRRAPKEQQ